MFVFACGKMLDSATKINMDTTSFPNCAEVGTSSQREKGCMAATTTGNEAGSRGAPLRRPVGYRGGDGCVKLADVGRAKAPRPGCYHSTDKL